MVGETPNLAARLQALAEPGSILLAQSTRELAGGLFEYADQGGPCVSKVFREPVGAWRVLRTSEVESRFDAAHSRSLTPLVGRHRELDLLLRLWLRARGMGKARSCFLPERRVSASRALLQALCERIVIRCICGLCASSARLTTPTARCIPLSSSLKEQADFRRGDKPGRKTGKSSNPCSRNPRRRQLKMSSLLAALLSVPAERPLSGAAPQMTPQQLKERTLGESCRSCVEVLAAQGAPVLVAVRRCALDRPHIDGAAQPVLPVRTRHRCARACRHHPPSRSAPDLAWLGQCST